MYLVPSVCSISQASSIVLPMQNWADLPDEFWLAVISQIGLQAWCRGGDMTCKTLHSLPLQALDIYPLYGPWSKPSYIVWAFARWSSVSKIGMMLNDGSADGRVVLDLVVDSLQRLTPNACIRRMHLTGGYSGRNLARLVSACASCMPALQDLEIQAAPLPDLSACAQLQQLQRVKIMFEGSKEKSSTTLQSLQQLTALESLSLRAQSDDVDHCTVCALDFGGLTRLTSLSLLLLSPEALKLPPGCQLSLTCTARNAVHSVWAGLPVQSFKLVVPGRARDMDKLLEHATQHVTFDYAGLESVELAARMSEMTFERDEHWCDLRAGLRAPLLASITSLSLTSEHAVQLWLPAVLCSRLLRLIVNSGYNSLDLEFGDVAALGRSVVHLKLQYKLINPGCVEGLSAALLPRGLRLAVKRVDYGMPLLMKCVIEGRQFDD